MLVHFLESWSGLHGQTVFLCTTDTYLVQSSTSAYCYAGFIESFLWQGRTCLLMHYEYLKFVLILE